MVETPEFDIDYPQESIDICCPRCKSRDVIIKKNKEGYFWVEICNNCRYKGKEGNSVGCINKKEPSQAKEDKL